MIDTNDDCARFESQLGELLDGSLETGSVEFMNSHAMSCEQCARLESDFRNISLSAAQLPAVMPAGDLWSGIDARIQARVIPLDDSRDLRGRIAQKSTDGNATGIRTSASQRALVALLKHPARLAAAAAVLVIMSAAATYGVIRIADPVSTIRRADSPGGTAAGEVIPARDPLPSQLDTTDPRYALLTAVARSYSGQIGSLQAVVSARRSSLDSATFRVIERNIGIIDAAIAECMAALAADPSSGFLLDQYRGALDAKVGLLRTAAMLPAAEAM